MPVLKEWLADGARVITPDGRGIIHRSGSCMGDSYSVDLDVPCAGHKVVTYAQGQIALDTLFTVVRILNVSGVGEITSAVNYPSWDEAIAAIRSCPFIQDETLIGLNFETGKIELNRPLPLQPSLYIIQAYYDLHARIARNTPSFSRKDEAEAAWANIAGLAGTTGHIMMAVYIDVLYQKVIKRALFSTLEVLVAER